MLIVLAQAEPPPAASAGPHPSIVTRPDWVRKPNAVDLGAHYPKEAANSGIEGHSTIRCTVNAEGVLFDCIVDSEEPAGAGFGSAALSVSSKFKMLPLAKDGVSVGGGTIRIPIRWVLPGRVTTRLIKVSHPGANGHVDADCRVSEAGLFDNCQIVQTTSGAALDDLTLQVVAKITVPSGAKVGLRVLFPIDFVSPGPAVPLS